MHEFWATRIFSFPKKRASQGLTVYQIKIFGLLLYCISFYIIKSNKCLVWKCVTGPIEGKRTHDGDNTLLPKNLRWYFFLSLDSKLFFHSIHVCNCFANFPPAQKSFGVLWGDPLVNFNFLFCTNPLKDFVFWRFFSLKTWFLTSGSCL